MGSKGGAVVRALSSHQCGPCSNPGVDAICGLSLLLALSLAPRGFSPGTPVFPSPQKPTLPNSNSIRNRIDEEPLCGCATSKSLLLLLLLLLLSLLLLLLLLLQAIPRPMVSKALLSVYSVIGKAKCVQRVRVSLPRN